MCGRAALLVAAGGLAWPAGAVASPPAESPPAAATSPASSATPATSDTVVPVRRLRWLVLRSEGMDDTSLADNLSLRVPDTQIIEPGREQDPLAADELGGLVQVGRKGETVSLTLVLTDGRAFDREVGDLEPDPERVVASELASLIAAALEGRIEADRIDDETFAEQGSGPDDGDPTGDGPGGDVPNVTEAIPGLELGLRFGGSLTQGLAPTGDLDRGTYGGGHLDVDLAWPRGGTLSLGFHVGGRSTPLGVTRFRGAFGGGYRWQRGRFEWLNLARAEIEGWRLDTRAELFSGGDPVPQRPPLLGVALTTSPGWRSDLRTQRRKLGLRVGPRIDAAVRGALGNPSGAPRIRDERGAQIDDPPGPVLARLGGFELSVGIEVELWFGLSRLRTAPPSTTTATPPARADASP